MVGYNFKKIVTVPNGQQFVDIALTRTQRQTPTVVHKGYKISVLRKFYMRKVKYTQQTINDKLQQITTDFPILDDIHPFYADLLNVLYDKDHYKLALGQINNARRLVENVCSDYLKLLKYGDSLYRCKQLKRAALGRMVKVIRRLDPSLAYLEQVRQHMARLPSIDPNTRTLLVCGFPNVGKSSFMRKVTRADVEVQPYPFTTKSLFVGHTDFKTLRWQVIDSPGILDHPLEDRNTIEMQSITALAHLRCAVLYFLDISETCNYSIEEQIHLFESISPLFEKKPLVIVLNKVDIRRPEDLTPEEQALINNISVRFPNTKVLPMSSQTEEGISLVKETACDMLLEMRVDLKLKGARREQVLNRLHVSVPTPRDDNERPAYERPTYIPPFEDMDVENFEGKVSLRKLDEFNEQKRLFYELDESYRGMDWKKYYDLEEDWRYDTIPEFMDGENIADWLDPDLETKWAELEGEEAGLLQSLAAQPQEEVDDLTPQEYEQLKKIRHKKALLLSEHGLKKVRNAPILPKQVRIGKISDMKNHLESLGIDSTKAVECVRERSKSRERSRSASLLTHGKKRSRGEMDSSESGLVSSTVGKNSAYTNNLVKPGRGISSEALAKKVIKMNRYTQHKMNLIRPGGAYDRSFVSFMPPHLYSGKRTIGKTDRR